MQTLVEISAKTLSSTPPKDLHSTMAVRDVHLDRTSEQGENRTLRKLQWKACVKAISSCEAAPGIRVSSVYDVVHNSKPPHSETQVPHSCMKPLFREIKYLRRMLPNDINSSIWVRFDEDTPQYMRAMMTAPENSPYEGGLFVFDIYVPNNYPMRSPHMTLLTTGNGSVRFGPNLYADGTICLSLLGSWNGPQWDPVSSNLYQLLVSVQSLILGAAQPFYLEPGRGGWEGTVRVVDDKDGVPMIEVDRWVRGTVAKALPWHVRRYNAYLTCAAAQWAMLDHLRQPAWNRLEPFQEAIRAHFYCNGRAICDRLNQVCTATPWGARALRLNNLKNTIIPALETCIAKIETPTYLKGIDKHYLLQTLGEDHVAKKKQNIVHGRAFEVQIPKGVASGDCFAVSVGIHRVYVRCPNDCEPGMRLCFRLFLEENKKPQCIVLSVSKLREKERPNRASSIPSMGIRDSTSDNHLASSTPKRFFCRKVKFPKAIRAVFQTKRYGGAAA